MLVKFNPTPHADVDGMRSQSSLDLTNMNREEAATIYFALTEYARNLETSLNENSTLEKNHNDIGTLFEDRMFLHDTLHKVYNLLYQLLEECDTEHPEGSLNFHGLAYRQWFDVV